MTPEEIKIGRTYRMTHMLPRKVISIICHKSWNGTEYQIVKTQVMGGKYPGRPSSEMLEWFAQNAIEDISDRAIEQARKS